DVVSRDSGHLNDYKTRDAEAFGAASHLLDLICARQSKMKQALQPDISTGKRHHQSQAAWNFVFHFVCRLMANRRPRQVHPELISVSYLLPEPGKRFAEVPMIFLAALTRMVRSGAS